MKILQIDIETAPHLAAIWGPKNAYIQPKNILQPGYTLCFASKWYGKPAITFKSVHHDGAEEMVNTAWDLLHEADAVIHYNGTKFDIPTLNADFVEHGLNPPSSYQEIDLLKTARQRFRLYSNKLDEVARWLGVGGKVQHKGLELWLECMGGCDKAWKVMRRYNRQDVALLELVYDRLLPWIKSHPNRALYTHPTGTTCPKCGSGNVKKDGFKYMQSQRYQQWACKECGSWFRDRSTAVAPSERENIKVPL